MTNLEKDIRHAVDCLAVSIKSIREADDIDTDKRAGMIAESQGQFAKHVSGLYLADIGKRAKSTGNEPFPGEPGRRGHGPDDSRVASQFQASGAGPAHEALWRSFDDKRRGIGAYAGERAFAEAWNALDETQKQQIRDEESAAEAARRRGEQSRRAAAQTEKLEMNKTELMTVAKRVIDGSDVRTTRSELVAAAHAAAAAERQSGQTVEKARAAFWESPAGREVYHAMAKAPLDDAAADRSSVVELGPAMAALHKRADEIRRGTSMTREAAVAKIATTPTEASIWRAAKSEQLEQVS
jgi:hypothetical protein